MVNIIIVGVNITGSIAGSQRIRNLFKPLYSRDDLNITNLIINDKINTDFSEQISIGLLKYNIYNPFSIFFFFIQSSLYLYKKFNQGSLNIIYHYGYANIENLVLLQVSKLIGYKVIFDIVELNSKASTSKTSRRMRFKNFTSRLFKNKLFKIGSLCFAISTDLVLYCRSICKDRIPVVHLPISVDVDFVKSFKKSKEDNDSKIRIFYGGSFGVKDGIDYLLRGFELACESNAHIELLLTGNISKHWDGLLQKQISNSKWKDRIRYLGCLTIAEYFEIMVNSDILLMTRINSLYAKTGFPFKLGEYLASGNAIIASDVGDVSKYLIDKHNAILIKPESEVDICNSIIMLCQDKELRNEIGKLGEMTALDYFSTEKVSKILLENITTLY